MPETNNSTNQGSPPKKPQSSEEPQKQKTPPAETSENNTPQQYADEDETTGMADFRLSQDQQIFAKRMMEEQRREMEWVNPEEIEEKDREEGEEDEDQGDMGETGEDIEKEEFIPEDTEQTETQEEENDEEEEEEKEDDSEKQSGADQAMEQLKKNDPTGAVSLADRVKKIFKGQASIPLIICTIIRAKIMAFGVYGAVRLLDNVIKEKNTDTAFCCMGCFGYLCLIAIYFGPIILAYLVISNAF